MKILKKMIESREVIPDSELTKFKVEKGAQEKAFAEAVQSEQQSIVKS